MKSFGISALISTLLASTAFADTLVVLRPWSAFAWNAGENVDIVIDYTRTNGDVPSIDVHLMNGQGQLQQIATIATGLAPAPHTISFKVPSGIPTGSDYTVKVSGGPVVNYSGRFTVNGGAAVTPNPTATTASGTQPTVTPRVDGGDLNTDNRDLSFIDDDSVAGNTKPFNIDALEGLIGSNDTMLNANTTEALKALLGARFNCVLNNGTDCTVSDDTTNPKPLRGAASMVAPMSMAGAAIATVAAFFF